eukprot:145573-Chlamydomonas_euryale.AAC.11
MASWRGSLGKEPSTWWDGQGLHISLKTAGRRPDMARVCAARAMLTSGPSKHAGTCSAALLSQHLSCKHCFHDPSDKHGTGELQTGVIIQ